MEYNVTEPLNMSTPTHLTTVLQVFKYKICRFVTFYRLADYQHVQKMHFWLKHPLPKFQVSATRKTVE